MDGKDKAKKHDINYVAAKDKIPGKTQMFMAKVKVQKPDIYVDFDGKVKPPDGDLDVGGKSGKESMEET